MSLASAVAGEKFNAIYLAATGGLVQRTRFWKFDRKPAIESGNFDAAAMIHDASNKLSIPHDVC